VDTVTYGVRNMPPWDDVLKPNDVEALWAYVQAVRGNRRNHEPNRTHAATAAIASLATCLVLAPGSIWTSAHAQGQPTGVKQTEVFKTTMNDVLGRVLSVRVLERDPGTGSGAHRHPGSHTVGYVLDGSYEVKIDDGPVHKLGPGEAFYRSAQRPARRVAQRQQDRAGEVPGHPGLRSDQARDRARIRALGRVRGILRYGMSLFKEST